MKVPERTSGWTKGKVIGAVFSGCLVVMYLMCLINEDEVTGGLGYGSVWKWLFVFGVALFLIIFLGITIVTIKAKINNIINIKNAKEYNKTAEVRYNDNMATAKKLKTAWSMRTSYLRKEFNKVNNLLQSYYGLNIIPNQYRNLGSVYYIYDYMSSSKASLNDTLMHEHMENGINRILVKLDEIISQNETIIFQNRKNEASNQQLLQSNKNMLASLEKTEALTNDAVNYARISANYTETCSFFLLANYLNK